MLAHPLPPGPMGHGLHESLRHDAYGGGGSGYGVGGGYRTPQQLPAQHPSPTHSGGHGLHDFVDHSGHGSGGSGGDGGGGGGSGGGSGGVSNSNTMEEVRRARADVLERARKVFITIDRDGDGKLDLVELRAKLGPAGIGMSDEEVQGLFCLMDANKDGRISQGEFLLYVREGLMGSRGGVEEGGGVEGGGGRWRGEPGLM
ncbi:hypothetical protein MMPV_002368 [Pyropia vietnamensis]